MPHPLSRWIRLVRPQDFVWLLVFGGLVATLRFLRPPLIPGDPPEILPLVALAVAQILEPRVPRRPTTRSRVSWIVLKVVLGFVLIAYTGGIYSDYWLVLFLPVVSAATTFGAGGTLVFTLLASGAYLAFFLFLREGEQATVDQVLPVVFLAMIGNLANTLAEDLRIQSEKHRRTAEQLAQANVQIQQAEEAVRRSDRLAALGQLSAGLAHELRNPLGTIKASSEMLNGTVSGENEVAREMAGFIGS